MAAVTKAVLREEIRCRLRALDSGEKQSASERICRTIESRPEWCAARLVCAFVPLLSEPQIQPLWERENGPAFCFPRIVGETVELIRIDDGAALVRAGWKLEGPEFSSCPRVRPAELDAILVPGLAFTRDGHRLGRGGGYYDRLLAQCPVSVARIGVGFECQILDALPTAAHDQRVHLVITGS